MSVTKTTPLMSVTAYRYAKALYALAEEQNCLLEIEDALKEFLNKVFLQPEFQMILPSPSFSQEHQVQFLDKFFAKIDQSTDANGCLKIFKNFLNVVISHRRLSNFADIVEAFSQLAAEKRQESLVLVETARPMTEQDREELLNELQKTTGRKIILQEEVVPSLLGGMVVRLGSQQIDTSLRTKLNSLKHALKEVS